MNICKLAVPFIFAAVAFASASAESEGGSEAGSVRQWDIFEETIPQRFDVANEFADVELTVTYTRPDGTTVDFFGFYAGDGVWKLRFMPDRTGRWRYQARFSNGFKGPSGTFQCVPSAIPGMISQDETNSMWFGYEGVGHALSPAAAPNSGTLPGAGGSRAGLSGRCRGWRRTGRPHASRGRYRQARLGLL